MSMLRSLILVGALGASSVAAAAPSRLSDSQFLELNRCRALMASTELGGGDVKAVDALLKAEGRGRDPYISEKGQSLQDDAASSARHASGDRRARLTAERDGACRALLGGQTGADGAGASQSVN